MRTVTKELIEDFSTYLINEEKSCNTVEKYIRDTTFFMLWLGDRELNKISVLEYKKELCEKYAPASVNSMLSSLNGFFSFMEWNDVRVKALKIQRQIFSNKEKELTKGEYEKLLSAAKSKKNLRLYYLMQTLGSTGIRVSELKYVTINSIKSEEVKINCKGKMRVVLLPHKLCKMLLKYARENSIKIGSIFVTKKGKPLDRSHIWKMLKSMCGKAGVSKSKVFPHNFRHLFARTYYSLQKDVVRLADILGHSSIDTTRIYTTETGDVHRRQLQRLGLLRC